MAKTITSICCSSILRRSPCRSWSTASRACRAVCYANGGQKCGDDTRTVFCGRHPISSLHAAARHFRLSLTTSNPKEKRPPGALAYLPGLKAGVSREGLDDVEAIAGFRLQPLLHLIGDGFGCADHLERAEGAAHILG